MLGLCAIGLAAVTAPQAVCQASATVTKPADAGAQAPAFEVASIRPSGLSQGEEVNGFYTYPGGRIVARGCSLKYLIMLAFDLQPFQISGAQGQIDDNGYDIQAKPSDSSRSSKLNPVSPKSPPSEEQRQMLQSLLIDRFQLKFHSAAKEGFVYILTESGKELKLQTPRDKNSYPWAGSIEGGLPSASGVRGENISMPQLVTRLSQWLGHPVLDQTGLLGSFDFEFRTGNEDSDADTTGSILTSIKGIGLKLESGKGPVETIVIDHVEKPSAN